MPRRMRPSAASLKALYWSIRSSTRGVVNGVLLPLFEMHYHYRVKFWIVVGPLWLVALTALVGILILPGNLDIYYHDTYIVVAKMHVVLAILLLIVLPLLWLTIWHSRSTNT
jgi:heme/copper-type cytochrome/quinol oxidase subunit 1